MPLVIRPARRVAGIRHARALWAVLLAAVLLASGQTALANHDARDGRDGNAYESPTYGYTVEWDADVWEPNEASTEDDVDTLILQSPLSYLSFVGVADDLGGPAACLDAMAEVISSEDGVDDWEPMEDGRGEPVVGEDDGRAWAVFTLTLTNGTGDTFENANYLECRTLGDGEVTLMILHLTSQDDYADQAEAVDEVLETIEPAGGAVVRAAGGRHAAARDRDREERDERDRAGADTERDTYVSPTWGYTVAWNPEVWTIWSEYSEDDGTDFLGLNLVGSFLFPGVSVNGFAGYDGDSEACLAGRVAEVEEDNDEPLVPVEGVDLPATVPGVAAGLYEDAEWGDYLYYECRTLVPGEAVVVIFFGVSAADYDEVLPAFEEILAEFELPEN